MNQNDLALRIVAREGGKRNLSIAQVKEVLRLTLEELAAAPAADLARLLAKHAKRRPAAKR